MTYKKYTITLLTPLLCHGSDKKAEIRIPSIRGHLRKWHTILWGIEDTKYCWGYVEQEKNKEEKVIASKVAIRLLPSELRGEKVDMLPHKKNNKVLTSGISSGQTFSMAVSYRYCNEKEVLNVKERVEKTIEFWLLLGTFGQRGTRAFGSVCDKSVNFSSPAIFMERVKSILASGARFRGWKATAAGKEKSYYAIQILKPCKDFEMKSCTDTLNGSSHLLGSIKPRQTSHLKMKVIKINNQKLLVLHAKNHNIIDEAVKLLRNKPIGREFTVIAANK